MKRILVTCLWVFVVTLSQTFAQSVKRPTYSAKKHVYEEVDLEEMIRRYFNKEISAHNSLEGIYSVSCVITKKNHQFITGREVERKDNYARVAIVKDWPGAKRDFIEVSMSYRIANKYPIVGEFVTLAEGVGLLYRHIEPDGRTLSYSMVQDSAELLEGEYSLVSKRKIITYKLSYFKIYPKDAPLTVYKN